MEQLKTLNPSTAFDIAKLNSLKMNIEGETSRLKNYAETKQKVADYQNTMNDYAQLHNLDAEALSKGKIKKAEHGVKLPIAQKGYKHISQGSGKIDYTPIGHTGNPLWDNINTYRNEWIPKVGNALNDDYVAKTLLSNIENYNGQDASDVKKAISQGRTYNEKLQIINKID